MRILTVLLFVLFSTPLWAAAPFTPEQEGRIKELIRETLIANPDILAQSVDAWQQQANEAQGQQLNQFIETNKHALYQDPVRNRLRLSQFEQAWATSISDADLRSFLL